MPTVVAVKLRYTPKILWFDPAVAAPVEGDHVIVETERGTEIGLATSGPFDVTEEELRAPLKRVLRVADERDLAKIDDLQRKSDEAMPVFRELVIKHALDMKPIDVEFLFGGDKAVFYFASEERVDFRELVRELASRFHIRVDMRQIGVRDEARMVGGIAHCGEELCCVRLGGEFQPVSIRMAKEQDLPLNPLKISGLCGRLMCCLRYEFEAYKDFKSRAPKKGAIIETPLGLAKVCDFDTPREVVNMRLEDGKHISIPLGKMDCGDSGCSGCGDNTPGSKGCGTRPCKVGREALDECASNNILLALSVMDRESEAAELADTAASHPRKGTGSTEKTAGGGSSRRKRGERPVAASGEPKPAPEKKQVKVSKPAAETPAEDKTSAGAEKGSKSGGQHSKPRKRRRSSGGAAQQGAEKAPQAQQSGEGRSQAAPSNAGRQGTKRPGQKSSGLRSASTSQPASPSSDGRRRRRHHDGGEGAGGSAKSNPDGSGNKQS